MLRSSLETLLAMLHMAPQKATYKSKINKVESGGSNYGRKHEHGGKICYWP